MSRLPNSPGKLPPPIPDKAASWFPAYADLTMGSFVVDQIFDDFDAQSERLDGHDQTYFQITPGRFYGRFLSCILGPHVSLHIEFANQGLEQEVTCQRGGYSFGLVLEPQEGFRACGHLVESSHLFVAPPGAELHLKSPANGVILALLIDQDTLLSQSGLSNRAQDWLLSLKHRIGVLQTPYLTRRLKEDCNLILTSPEEARKGPILNAFLAGLAGSLSLALETCSELKEPTNFLAFREMRNVFLRQRGEGLMQPIDRPTRRLVNQQMGLAPGTYERTLRLNTVRRALLSPNLRHQTIGDLAAEHGFWDWSRFSGSYKTLFGELPSQTRRKSGSGSLNPALNH